MATVSVRYIVNDVDAAIGFYTRHLGFTEVMHPAPAFAMLSRGDLRLVLSAPGAGPGGGQAMPDGSSARIRRATRLSYSSRRCRKPNSSRRRTLVQWEGEKLQHSAFRAAPRGQVAEMAVLAEVAKG